MKFSSMPVVSMALLGLVSLLSPEVGAHSWLTTPVSRETEAHDDVPGKMGCPSNTPGKSTSFKAGETIDVRYWRNNHLGGFIRWSIVPLGQESKTAFDMTDFYYTCRESGATCLPKGPNSKFASDNSGDNTISCGDKIVLPDWLPAGDYVLQWTYFGAGSSFGNLGWAEAQFRSCADIKLTTAGAKAAAPSCPTFVGGDRVTKLTNQGNDKCFYFYTTDIVGSQYKGSNTDYEKNYKFGIPAPVEKCSGGGNSTSTTTEAPTPAASTKAPVDGEATLAPATSPPTTPGTGKTPAPRRTRSPRPRHSRTTAPSKEPVASDADVGEVVATVTPADPTNVPDCKAKSAN